MGSGLVENILANNDEKSDIGINFANTSSTDGTNGLYFTSTNTENSATTYYFRGPVTNNYLKFAGYTWRIVRINEDGSVRIITQDTVGQIEYNSTSNDNAYVGYMYGTPGSENYNDTHDNISSSRIKENIVDPWYTSNLSSFSSYIADAGFCSDKSIYSGDGTLMSQTLYNTYKRLRIDFQPQFMCNNATNNLYTLKGNTKGNQALTYPVGLLSVDEAYYAGGAYDQTTNSYLNTGANYWTMSPSDFENTNAVVWYIDTAGQLHRSATHFGAGVRPVINLKSTVEITGGDGRVGSEYVIKTS